MSPTPSTSVTARFLAKSARFTGSQTEDYNSSHKCTVQWWLERWRCFANNARTLQMKNRFTTSLAGEMGV